MKTKDEISKNYMESMKSLHAGKKLRPDNKRKIFISGVSPGNIGEGIQNKLKEKFSGILSVGAEIDLTKDGSIDSTLCAAQNYDTMILCHGYTYLDWIENQSFSKIDQMIEANLTSQIKMISKFVNWTIDKNYKKQIIVIGSMAANAVLNGSSPYCAAKAGLQHFIKCVAWELAPKGFDVFILNPSNVENAPMSESTIRDLVRYRGLSRESAEAYWSAVKPKNDFLTKHEISDIVSLIVEGRMEYMSGAPFNLVGGQR